MHAIKHSIAGFPQSWPVLSRVHVHTPGHPRIHFSHLNTPHTPKPPCVTASPSPAQLLLQFVFIHGGAHGQTRILIFTPSSKYHAALLISAASSRSGSSLPARRDPNGSSSTVIVPISAVAV